ncbi:AAA family ATPase [Archangium sp.]|uniref:AAA family ATPase n=1 Tax=Archangium sp. TaxID=1872627 RepID=UPI00286C2B02|nr:AAA family ATPase [Archangium sp.]
MKLTVHNLGRIKDAELDIKPLTVFSGHNGTNKTWLAWALFELLRAVSTGPNAVQMVMRGGDPDPLSEKVREKLEPLFEVLSQGTSTAAVTLGVGALEVWPDGMLHTAMSHDNLTELLGKRADLAVGAHVDLSISIHEMEARHESVVVEFEPELGRLNVTSNWYFADGPPRAVKRSFTRPDWDDAALTHIAEWSLHQLLMTVLCFPAERAGLLLTAEGGDTDLELPDPMNDFLKVMRLMRTTRRESPLREQLLPFLSRIAGGEIRLAGAKGEERLVLDVAGRELPISVASSLSRSVAGLSHYLRAFASPGDVLLIDELEMNAHPVAQLALVELMAVMVSYGIRIVFTTHSPYVIDHLNNLLEAGRAPEDRREKLAEEFRLRTSRAFLSADKVSVYAFEEMEMPDGSEVKVTNAIDPKSGLITKSTFAPVTQRLSQLFNAALDASEADE